MSIEDKRRLWKFLPARPKNLNKSGEIYTISGDFAYTYDPSIYPGNTNLTDILARIVEGDSKVLETEMSKAEVADMLKSHLIDFANTKGLAGLGALINGVIIAADIVNRRKIARSTTTVSTDNSSSRISRRTFIQALGFGLVGLSIPRVFLPSLAARSTSEDLKNILQNINSVIRPRLFLNEFNNARTALLFDKEEDAITYLGLPKNTPGSVIMGTGHGFEAENLMGSDEARENSIRNFSSHLLNIIDAILTKQNALYLRHTAHNLLLDYLATADIVKFRDPGGPDVNPNLPDLVITSVEKVAQFKSSKVESATNGLRL